MYVDLNKVPKEKLHDICRSIAKDKGLFISRWGFSELSAYGWIPELVDKWGYQWSIKYEGNGKGAYLTKYINGVPQNPGYFYRFPIPGKEVDWWDICRAVLSAELENDFIDLPDEMCESLGI